jgi:excinuclease ABC subunit A|tara:strand:- start:10714 stop:13491 length:2778 start_codon:yes stop_codon:yes gene_type:complete
LENIKLDSKFIKIRGANMHNLKNIDLDIPKNKLIVLTGLSGSGKSSLAFDTLYAEGQRRYIESLSSYARQFLGKLNKPKVDKIIGISPAIAIEQKVNNSNPRSTVGTSSEVYDYLKLLYGRIGRTYSPVSNKEVKKDNIDSVIKKIQTFKQGDKFLVLSLKENNGNENDKELLEMFLKQGFARIQINGEIKRIEDVKKISVKKFNLVIDRSIYKEDKDYLNRISDSIELAFYEGKGELCIENINTNNKYYFNNKYERDGIKFIEPSEYLFSFNNPVGACSSCGGYGDLIGIDPELVIPNTGLSIYENAIAPWRGEKLKKYKNDFIKNSAKFKFPIHKPYFKLEKEQKQILWEGNSYFKGINYFFNKLESKIYKIQNRVMLSRYRGKTKCNVCNGNRLKEEASFVKINNKSITDLVEMPIDLLLNFMKELKLNKYENKLAERITKEIKNRLSFICNVGLGYLTINRKSSTLSGGESQRINLANSLGSSLVSSLYVLDEPSIGLHPKDTEKLINILIDLKKIGNTVLVVEHDEDIMKAADQIIDIGPQAGSNGGEVVAQGTIKEILKSNSLTSKYLNNIESIKVPNKRRYSSGKVILKGARENNLKNINVVFPLNNLTAVTGVSGSGKTTLVKKILYPALLKEKGIFKEKPGQFDEISGDIDKIEEIEYVDQNPIGLSSRSNPVTYLKVYDDIRSLFASQSLSKANQYKAKHFSFNVDGGRCTNCKGEGTVKIEMQFMADVNLICENCKGKRFKEEVLRVKFKDKNIDDILKMTVDQSIDFFKEQNENRIVKKLQPLKDVGMGYVQLGQSSSTLSGGEAQRIKLATFLLKGSNRKKTLFIFDEPTTGLHFHDIKKLLKSFNSLIENGHSLIVVEHNIDLIKSSDYIIDLGLDGGYNGGQVIFQGTPENLVKENKSRLSDFLKEKLTI